MILRETDSRKYVLTLHLYYHLFLTLLLTSILTLGSHTNRFRFEAAEGRRLCQIQAAVVCSRCLQGTR